MQKLSARQSTLNKVYLADGLLRIDVVGNQTGESVKAMGQEIVAIIDELRSENQPVLILDNVIGIGKASPDALRNVAILTKLLDYDRAAMVARSRAMRISVNTLLRAVGRHDTKYFSNIAKAERWLSEYE